jgi:ADP-ribose pyrophosphatase YjhB (NUDIX family)
MSTTWRPPQFVRPLAIGVVRRGTELLVAAVQDDAGSIKGWRPLGGSIEFGERAAETLRREFREEVGLEILEPRLLAVIENLYEHHGARGHDIAIVFQTALARAEAYQREAFEFHDGGIDCQARWVDIGRFRSGEQQLFPAGLIDRL